MMICSAIKINWKNLIKMMMTWRLPLEQSCNDSCTHPQTYTGAKKCELVPNKAKAPSPGQTCWRLSCYFVENSKVGTKLTYEPETLPASRDFMCTTHQRSTVIQHTSVKQKNLFVLYWGTWKEQCTCSFASFSCKFTFQWFPMVGKTTGVGLGGFTSNHSVHS